MPDVERDRQAERGVDPRRGGVERELADRDSHAPGPLVAQAEDPLVVGDDDQADVLVGGVAEHGGDVVDVLGRDPQAARIADDMAVELAGLAHGRGVDDGQELAQVLDQHAVEERLVAVLQGRQPDVLLQVVGLGPDPLELEGHLLLDGEPGVGQEPAEAEPSRSLIGERRLLVQQRIAKQPGPGRTLRVAGFPAIRLCLWSGNRPSPCLGLRLGSRSARPVLDLGYLVLETAQSLFEPVQRRVFSLAEGCRSGRESAASREPARGVAQAPDSLRQVGDSLLQVFLVARDGRWIRRPGERESESGGIIALIQSMGARNGARGGGCFICSRRASDCFR